jgi:murein L,D-transpeptidase YafK
MACARGHCVFSRSILGDMINRSYGIGLLLGLGWLLAACSQTELPAHLRPLSKETMMLLGNKGMSSGAPIFIRVFKEESELEVWKQRDDGRFYHFKTYPICNWSGEIGPKVHQGDKQAPEGFYTIFRHQMNPSSQYHLAFNLGYPNAYDKALGRSGEHLMVHGNCKSAGCYAMTDALIEEIYALAREAFIGGQESFEVHAFPFRMTDTNMARFKGHQWYAFWKTLKEGYDYFETTRLPPSVTVCNRSYMVNVKLVDNQTGRIDPERPCPTLQRVVAQPFTPRPSEQKLANERITVPGPKLRAIAASDFAGQRSGLTKSSVEPFGYDYLTSLLATSLQPQLEKSP